MATNDGRIDRLGRVYQTKGDATGALWAQWERERVAALQFLRDKPVALAEFHAVERHWRMDEKRPLTRETWLTFCGAKAKALHHVCSARDSERLADVIAVSENGRWTA